MSDKVVKHTLTRDLGRWLCTRCRKTGEKWWLDNQPCIEAAPVIMPPIVVEAPIDATMASGAPWLLILGSKFKP